MLIDFDKGLLKCDKCGHTFFVSENISQIKPVYHQQYETLYQKLQPVSRLKCANCGHIQVSGEIQVKAPNA